MSSFVFGALDFSGMKGTSAGGGSVLIGNDLGVDEDEMASFLAKYFSLKLCLDDNMQTK